MTMRLKPKMITAFLAVGVIPFVLISVISVSKSDTSLEKAAFNQLESVRSTKLQQIQDYLDSIQQDAQIMAANKSVRDALSDFSFAWLQLGGDQVETLQRLYIRDNPNPTGSKHLLDFANDQSIYAQAHARYHPWFREWLLGRGYYDIFLVDGYGNVFYTVYKEHDFATNLKTGRWKDTELARIYNAINTEHEEGKIYFTDIAPYAASADAPASFIGTPIFNSSGVYQGALIIQMPLGKINEIMGERQGLGKTGEAYLVGQDLLMRSDSHNDPKGRTVSASFANPQAGKADTEAVRQALSGQTGVGILSNYSGEKVLSAYAPVEIMGVRWAMMAEIAQDEAFQAISDLQGLMLIIGTVGIAVIAGAGYVMATTTAKPIIGMTDAMTELSGGNKLVDIPGVGKRDEIGQMADAVQVFKENMIRAEQLDEEQAREREAREERAKRIETLTLNFDTAVNGTLDTVASASTQLQATAQSMTTIAEQTSNHSSAVATAAEEASSNVQTVASAAEELTSSISEISRQVSQSTQIANAAVAEVDLANDKVQGLADAANKIGEVVALITDIADQTNLLALNATIEAARAGDAGKGFAVVASEVKNLASQTAKATEEISGQIGGIQGATQEAVTAIGSIGGTISQMSEISSTIAAAVEEQGAATQEIARNVEQAAQGTKEVSGTISQVTLDASETNSSAAEVLDAANGLGRQAELLRKEVDTFFDDIRRC